MDNKIDIERELERIKADLRDMEEAGIQQVFLDFFGGAENEREFITAAVALVRSRGYSAEVEYEDGELVLIVSKEA